MVGQGEEGKACCVSVTFPIPSGNVCAEGQCSAEAGAERTTHNAHQSAFQA